MRGLLIRDGFVDNIIVIDLAEVENFCASSGAQYILDQDAYSPKPQIGWLYTNGVFTPPEE